MANWRQLYTAAMIETDVDNLGVLIEETSRAIEVRLDELKKGQNGYGERKEIADVANALVALKADRIALDEPDADAGA
jgi:hypothetical protein